MPSEPFVPVIPTAYRTDASLQRAVRGWWRLPTCTPRQAFAFSDDPIDDFPVPERAGTADQRLPLASPRHGARRRASTGLEHSWPIIRKGRAHWAGPRLARLFEEPAGAA